MFIMCSIFKITMHSFSEGRRSYRSEGLGGKIRMRRRRGEQEKREKERKRERERERRGRERRSWT